MGSKIVTSNEKFRSSNQITVEAQEIEIESNNQLLYFLNCKSSKITVPKTKAPSIKVIIDGCIDTLIELNSSILTNTIEIINSNGLVLKLNTKAFTIQCDQSKSVNIQISERKFFQTLVSSQAEELNIIVENDNHSVPLLRFLDQEANPLTSQILTHYVNEEIMSEFIVREGEGYISTKRLNEEYKIEAQKNQEAYEKWVSGMITFEEKENKENDDNKENN